MEPLTQAALWRLVLGLAGVALALVGLLYVVDKCGTRRSAESPKRADAPAATDTVGAGLDRGHGQAHHERGP